MSALPDAVLFVCNRNTVRSPAAAALLRHRLGARLFVESCGLEPGEASDPFVVAAMAELGFDLSHHQPKSIEEVADGSFDLLISLTPQAQHHATEFARGRAVDLEYWPVVDPTEADGGREQRLQAYRDMTRELARRIAGRFPLPAGAGG